MAALKSMRRRKRGRIIQMGSALAYRGIPLQAAYCGAKHAIRGFTNSLRAELIAEGSPIRVSIVELPAVNTPQFDWARAHTQPHAAPDGPADRAGGRRRRGLPRCRADHGANTGSAWPTMLLILGDFVLPGALDQYLARTAIGGQQTKTPLEPSRPDNLEHPVTPLHRVRGSFGAEAENHAPFVIGEVGAARDRRGRGARLLRRRRGLRIEQASPSASSGVAFRALPALPGSAGEVGRRSRPGARSSTV